MKYKHVQIGSMELMRMAREAKLQNGTNLPDWWLNTHAPGKLISASTTIQPIQNPLLDPRGGGTAELVFHFFFEVVEVIS